MAINNLPENKRPVNDTENMEWFRSLTDDEQDAVLDDLFDQFMRQPDWERQQLKAQQEEHCWRRHVAANELGVKIVVVWN